jgi:CBS domain-containing protein
MTTRVVTTDAAWSMENASRLMRQFGVKRLPVVSGDRLVGIVTREEAVDAPNVVPRAAGP